MCECITLFLKKILYREQQEEILMVRQWHNSIVITKLRCKLKFANLASIKGLLEEASHCLTVSHRQRNWKGWREEKPVLTYSWVMVVREPMTNELHCHCCREKREREEKIIISPSLNRNSQKNTWITHSCKYQIRLWTQFCSMSTSATMRWLCIDNSELIN